MNQRRIVIISFLVFNNFVFINSYKAMIPRIDRENSHRFNIVKNYHQELRRQEQSISSLGNNNDDFNFLITIILLRIIIIIETYYYNITNIFDLF